MLSHLLCKSVTFNLMFCSKMSGYDSELNVNKVKNKWCVLEMNYFKSALCQCDLSPLLSMTGNPYLSCSISYCHHVESLNMLNKKDAYGNWQFMKYCERIFTLVYRKPSSTCWAYESQSFVKVFMNRLIFCLSTGLKLKTRPHILTLLQILLGSFEMISGDVCTVWYYSVFRHWELIVVSSFPLRSNMSCTARWAPLSSCARSVPRMTRMWRLSPVVISCAPPVSLPGR